MPDYLPHTEDDIASMLGFLGLSSLEELFAAVPQALRLTGGLALEEGGPEPGVLPWFDEAARANATAGLVCFAGAGAYDHEVPAVVRSLAGRSEFVTSYTPYQAEVAQGVLQAVFEFQTLVSRLSGLPIANASLYDGAGPRRPARRRAGDGGRSGGGRHPEEPRRVGGRRHGRRGAGPGRPPRLR